ncbi:hypothetical protein SLE2022_124940 [Rubroshorea leprosula]
MGEAEPQPPPSTLRRRNSNRVLVPAKLALPTTKPLLATFSLPNGSASSQPPLDLDFSSLKSPFTTYTSLKDIIPSSVAVNSPTAAAPTSNSGCQISIRNRLVKQAAWAYLQPMSSPPDSSGPHFIRRLWLRLSSHNPLSSFLQFIHIHLLPALMRVFDRILLILGIHAPR